MLLNTYMIVVANLNKFYSDTKFVPNVYFSTGFKSTAALKWNYHLSLIILSNKQLNHMSPWSNLNGSTH